MLNTSTALTVAAGVVLYSTLSKASALKTLNFYPAAVKDIRFDGATPVMTIGLAVQNTSNQKLVLHSFAGNLTANSYLIGNASLFTPTQILPNKQTVIWMNVRLSLIGIVQDILQAFNGNGSAQNIVLSATANIDRWQVPLNLKYKVG
jgi:hypothetical protein